MVGAEDVVRRSPIEERWLQALNQHKLPRVVRCNQRCEHTSKHEYRPKQQREQNTDASAQLAPTRTEPGPADVLQGRFVDALAGGGHSADALMRGSMYR